MQIELLKNKKTNIIEKLIINHHNNSRLKNLAILKLTHDESMIMLGKIDIKWHETIINYRHQQNKLKIMQEAQKDFHQNRKLNFLLNYFFNFHEELTKKKSFNQKLDIWYINYYFWCFFYIVLKGLVWNNQVKINNPIDQDYQPVFDPFILFMLEGIEYTTENKLLKSEDQQELKFIFNMHLQTKPDDLFSQLKQNHCNDQNINLLIFEKEVILKNQLEQQEYVFWLLKERTIANYLCEIIDYKIHYHQNFAN